MEAVFYICGSIALLMVGGLCIYLISFLGKTREMMRKVTDAQAGIGEDIRAFRIKADGTLDTVNSLANKLGTTVDRVNDQLDEVQGVIHSGNKLMMQTSEAVDDVLEVVESGKGVVVSLLELEQRIQKMVQEPVLEILHIFSALGKGVNAFRSKMGGGTTTKRPAERPTSYLPEDGEEGMESAIAGDGRYTAPSYKI